MALDLFLGFKAIPHNLVQPFVIFVHPEPLKAVRPKVRH
jgi:hypothetical protein